jgi:hypothetical protein
MVGGESETTLDHAKRAVVDVWLVLRTVPGARLSNSAPTSPVTLPLTRMVHISYTLPAVRWLDYSSTEPIRLQGDDLHIRCHRLTQLVLGSINATIPSNCVKVRDCVRSGESFICTCWLAENGVSGVVGEELKGLFRVGVTISMEVSGSLDGQKQKTCPALPGLGWDGGLTWEVVGCSPAVPGRDPRFSHQIWQNCGICLGCSEVRGGRG